MDEYNAMLTGIPERDKRILKQATSEQYQRTQDIIRFCFGRFTPLLLVGLASIIKFTAADSNLEGFDLADRYFVSAAGIHALDYLFFR